MYVHDAPNNEDVLADLVNKNACELTHAGIHTQAQLPIKYQHMHARTYARAYKKTSKQNCNDFHIRRPLFRCSSLRVPVPRAPTVHNQLGPTSSLLSIPRSGMKARDVAHPMAMTVLILGDDSLITLQQTYNIIRIVVSHKALLCRPLCH